MKVKSIGISAAGSTTTIGNLLTTLDNKARMDEDFRIEIRDVFSKMLGEMLMDGSLEPQEITPNKKD